MSENIKKEQIVNRSEFLNDSTQAGDSCIQSKLASQINEGRKLGFQEELSDEVSDGIDEVNMGSSGLGSNESFNQASSMNSSPLDRALENNGFSQVYAITNNSGFSNSQKPLVYKLK